MCLQVPLKVVGVENERVFVEGNRILIHKGKASVAKGDYVLAFGDLVVSVLSAQEAQALRLSMRKLTSAYFGIDSDNRWFEMSKVQGGGESESAIKTLKH